MRSFLAWPWRTLRWMLLARPIRFTRLGIFYVLFSIGVGAAAINTGNNLLYLILGVLLGFIVISGFLSDSCLWGLASEWSSNGNLYAGQPALFDCRLKKGWFPSITLTVTGEWENLPPQARTLFWVPSHGEALLHFSTQPQRRGWLHLERVRYATRFPFGLFEKIHQHRHEESWLVYPRVRPLTFAETNGASDRANDQMANRLGDGAVPFLLRDFRIGDSARRISWKASAKSQRWIVKDMEEETDAGDWLVVGSWPAALDISLQEDLISFIASLVFYFHQQDRPVGLITPDAVFPPDDSRNQMQKVLKYLALVDPAHPTAETAGARRPPATSGALDVIALWKDSRDAARA